MVSERMHDDEVAIDDALVRRLVQTQLPRWADLPLARVLSSGTDNALFRLGRDLVVRLPRIHWAVDDVDTEQVWLPRLEPQLPVAIPEPVAMGEPALGYPWRWSVYTWIEGSNPSRDDLARPDELAADIASFVTALRRIDPSGAPAAGRGVPLRDRDSLTRAAIAELGAEIDAVAVTAAWDAALAAAPWSGPPVWVHGDLSPGNLLLRDDRLHAVIDFGCLGTGDPAVDLLPAWNLLPVEARPEFRAALDVDDATWARGRGWALSVALVALPYYARRSPAIADRERRVVAEVLADRG